MDCVCVCMCVCLCMYTQPVVVAMVREGLFNSGKESEISMTMSMTSSRDQA